MGCRGWDATPPLSDCRVPVLVVHGDRDRLFPVCMAEELAELCEPPARLIVVPGLGHDDPFYRPTMGYWGMIAEWVLEGLAGRMRGLSQRR